MINPSFSGSCLYTGMRAASDEKSPQKMIARCWEGGYEKFQNNDPLRVATNIYSHLVTHYPNLVEAQTAPQIAAIVSPGNDYNISHICEVLVKLGFLKKAQDKNQEQLAYYPDKDYGKLYDAVLYDKRKALGSPAMREKYVQLLDLLYGYVTAASGKKTATQLKRPHFNIQYELVF